jgi:cytochrome b pre-mRNA-processing protein 3
MTFLFGRRRIADNRKIIDRLNDDIVAAVRAPAFYEAGGVEDTFQGRFELLVLHTALVVRRLKALPEPAGAAAQDLIDTVFRNLDPALRELGVGDMAVPKRMKRLAEAFLGRSAAYAAALNAGDAAALAAALSRNIYNGARPAADLAAYVEAAVAMLDAHDFDRLMGRPLPLPDAAAFMAEEKP